MSDPYLIWARKTGFSAQRGRRPIDDPGFRVRLIGRLQRPLSDRDRQTLQQAGMQVPACYLGQSIVTLSGPVDAIAGIEALDLVDRLALASARIGHAPPGPLAGHRPIDAADAADAAASSPPAGSGHAGADAGTGATDADADPDADADTNADADTDGASPAHWQASHTVIAVIDHGIAFAHPIFRHAQGGTRILYLWDQTDQYDTGPRPAPWVAETDFGYGHRLSGTAIDRCTGPPRAAEPWTGQSPEQLYRTLRYEPALGKRAHGTHVAAIAAGWPDPIQSCPGSMPGASLATAADDPVAGMPVILVQMPYLPVKDTSGGGLAAQLLDAVHDILAHLPSGTRHLVINVSDGALAGAHDGTALFEAAIEDLIRQHRERGSLQLAVTLAAGNAHAPRADPATSTTAERVEAAIAARAPRLHASGPIAPGAACWLDWQVQPDCPHESYLELWASGPGADALAVSLHTPTGHANISVKTGEQAWIVAAPAGAAPTGIRAGLISVSPNALGQGPVTLAAIAATTDTDAVASAPHGIWRVRLRNTGTEPLQVHAFVERNDQPYPEYRRQRQSRLIDRPATWGGRDYLPCDPQTTLSSLASGVGPIVVGGYCWRDQREHGAVWYSASGPARGTGPTARPGPDCVAAADESHVLHGVPVPGNQSAAWTRMDGTSVAAPRIARYLATGWSQWPDATPQALLSRLPPSPAAALAREGERRLQVLSV